jgi:hypothetical protein
MEKISYDFSEIEAILFSIKNSPLPSSLNKLKIELNKFFKDSTCRDVLYNNNTDGLFFGMCVMPVMSGEEAINVLTGDRTPRIEYYYLELDSKLFNPILGLTSEQLTAILLHEIGHMVNDTKPLDSVKNSLDIYLDKNKTNLSISDSIHYRELLAFAIKETARKFASIFEKEDEEIIADEFSVRCGYGPALEEAYRRIVKSSGKINRNVNSKLLVLDWTLRLYRDIKFQRIGALKTLNKIKSSNPSKLSKREIEVVIRSLNKIDDDALLEASHVMKKSEKSSSLFKQIKQSGMRSLEDDVYEYNMRIRNVEEEDDALLILRQINSRMAIIDDYINTEKLDEYERDRYINLYDKYTLLREELSKKSTYTKKYYGLFMDYSQLSNYQR